MNKLSEVEERLRRAEDSGKENKSALRWFPFSALSAFSLGQDGLSALLLSKRL